MCAAAECFRHKPCQAWGVAGLWERFACLCTVNACATFPQGLYSGQFSTEGTCCSPYVGTVSLAFVGPPSVRVQLAPYNRVRLMRIPILQVNSTLYLRTGLQLTWSGS